MILAQFCSTILWLYPLTESSGKVLQVAIASWENKLEEWRPPWKFWRLLSSLLIMTGGRGVKDMKILHGPGAPWWHQSRKMCQCGVLTEGKANSAHRKVSQPMGTSQLWAGLCRLLPVLLGLVRKKYLFWRWVCLVFFLFGWFLGIFLGGGGESYTNGLWEAEKLKMWGW